jgi:hypothetical protein
LFLAAAGEAARRRGSTEEKEKMRAGAADIATKQS